MSSRFQLWRGRAGAGSVRPSPFGALSPFGTWPVGSAVARRGETIPAAFASLTRTTANAMLLPESPTKALTLHSQALRSPDPPCTPHGRVFTSIFSCEEEEEEEKD
ncbi:UNVERIFIED_CONTAM: hypothetical protein FKN15_013559 [Acipenser sinensis]